MVLTDDPSSRFYLQPSYVFLFSHATNFTALRNYPNYHDHYLCDHHYFC